MKYTKSLRGVTASVLAAVLFAGCASSNGIKTYNESHSRAWNLTHSVGMTQLKDTKAPRGQIPSSILKTAGMGIDVAYFMSSPTLSMNFGDAFGLGLVGLLANTSKAHGERSTIVAWVPENEAENPESALVWVGDQVKEATLKAMKTLEIEGRVDFHGKRHKVPFSAAIFKSEISGTKKNGTECGVQFRTYDGIVSDLQPIPDFILPGSKGYQIYAGEKVAYPAFAAYCIHDELDQYLEFISEISRNLPETVFLYTRYIKHNDNISLPPMVHDHGAALLFIVEED